jgi:hypothetical protein
MRYIQCSGDRRRFWRLEYLISILPGSRRQQAGKKRRENRRSSHENSCQGPEDPHRTNVGRTVILYDLREFALECRKFADVGLQNLIGKGDIQIAQGSRGARVETGFESSGVARHDQ